jgi:hypothetical protein
MKHLFHLYGYSLGNFFRFKSFNLDIDGDGSITPLDFEILADKLFTLVGQENIQRREEYSSARKILCDEIMRADANQDGKVTLGIHFQFIFKPSNIFFRRRMARFPSKSC